MPGARSGPDDNLRLIAATAILVLTAQHFFQPGAKAGSSGKLIAQSVSASREQAREPAAQAGIINWVAIPWAAWKHILWRIYQRTNDDRLLATAAGVVFFGLLAIFPAVTALVSSYGLFADPRTVGANLQTLAVMLPEGSFQIVQDQIARVLAKGNAALGGTFLFGLALALWSANAGVKAIIDALNVVYEVRETRNFPKLNLLSLGFTTGGIMALLLMVGAVVAFPLMFNHLGLPPESGLILGLVRWPFRPGALAVAVGGPAAGAEPALPVRPQPARGAVGMAGRRDAGRGAALDRRLGRAVLVPLEFRQLQRDLRLAWRRNRPDDVDVDIGNDRAVRGGAELGDRAPCDRRRPGRQTDG